MAKTKGIRALEVEKQRQEAEAKQRKELQVSLLSDITEDSHAVSSSKLPLTSDWHSLHYPDSRHLLFMDDGHVQHYSAASVLYAPSCEPSASPHESVLCTCRGENSRRLPLCQRWRKRK